MVELLENVRGKDVFVLQSTCAPTNDNLMELLVMVDALKRASAGARHRRDPVLRLCAPGSPAALGARRDQRQGGRQHAQAVGVERVLTMDLHADQIQGFFDIPVDNIYAAPLLLGDVWKQRYDEPDRRVAGRRRRGARPGARQAPGVRPGDHRQAPPARERVRGDERDRRGRRPHLRDHGRHGRHRGHAVQGGAGAEAGGRNQGGRLLHARGVLRRRGRAHRRVGAGRAGGDRHHSAAARRRRRAPRSGSCRVATLLAETILRIIHRGIGEFAVHRVGLSTLPVSGRGPGGNMRRSKT